MGDDPVYSPAGPRLPEAPRPIAADIGRLYYAVSGRRNTACTATRMPCAPAAALPKWENILTM